MRFSALLTLILAVTLSPFLGGCHHFRPVMIPGGGFIHWPDSNAQSDEVVPCQSCGEQHLTQQHLTQQRPVRIGLLRRIRLNRGLLNPYRIEGAETDVIGNGLDRSSDYDSYKRPGEAPEGNLLSNSLMTDDQKPGEFANIEGLDAQILDRDDEAILSSVIHSDSDLVDDFDSAPAPPNEAANYESAAETTTEPEPSALETSPSHELGTDGGYDAPSKFADPEQDPGEPIIQPASIEMQLEMQLDSPQYVPSTSIKDRSKENEVQPEPIILRAQPTGNHYFKPRENSSVESNSQVPRSGRSFKYPQGATTSAVPVHRANLSTARSLDSSSLDPSDQPGLQRVLSLNLPRLEQTQKSNPVYSHLRAESDAAKVRQRLLDIQAIVKYEIDRRIQNGELTVPLTLPSTNSYAESSTMPITGDSPTSTLKIVTIAVPVPVFESSTRSQEPRTILHSVQPKTNSSSEQRLRSRAELILESGASQIRRPDRKPAVPIQSFDQSFDQGEHLFQVNSNLFIPVLEISEPALKQTRAIPVTEILRLRASQMNADSQPSIARFRNAAVQYRYVPTFPTADDSERPRTDDLPQQDSTIIVIPRIRATPIHENKRLEQSVRSLSELKTGESPSELRVLNRY